jgi:hypothetical protein
VPVSEVPLWLTILLAVGSGVLGSVLTIYQARRDERRRWRIATFQRLVANRHAIAEGDGVSDGVREQFFSALNEVFVVFHDAPDVISAAERLQANLDRPERFTDDFVALFKVIAKELRFSFGLRESFILRPFKPANNARRRGA